MATLQKITISGISYKIEFVGNGINGNVYKVLDGDIELGRIAEGNGDGWFVVLAGNDRPTASGMSELDDAATALVELYSEAAKQAAIKATYTFTTVNTATTICNADGAKVGETGLYNSNGKFYCLIHEPYSDNKFFLEDSKKELIFFANKEDAQNRIIEIYEQLLAKFELEKQLEELKPVSPAPINPIKNNIPTAQQNTYRVYDSMGRIAGYIIASNINEARLQLKDQMNKYGAYAVVKRVYNGGARA